MVRLRAGVGVGQWVLLVYRLPREPSTPRIALWRKLKRLGVVQLTDGLVALPDDARNREQLEWLADEISDAGGQGWIWLAQPGTAAQERALAARMAAAVAEEYEQVITETRAAAGTEPGVRLREVRRLRRQLQRIRQRDYFPPAQRDAAHRALDALAHDLPVPP